MDANKGLINIKSELETCARSILRAVESCDSPEELDELNAYIQSARQVLQNATYLIGKAIQDRLNAP